MSEATRWPFKLLITCLYDSSTRIKHTQPVKMAEATALENIGEVSALENIGEDIFEEGLKYLEETVKFAVVKLSSCNGMKSNPFSKAYCEFEFFGQEENTIVIPFPYLFKKGMTFLNEMDMVKRGQREIGMLENPEQNALLRLNNFFKKKG